MKKSEETSRRYTDHVVGILKEYDEVRLRNFENEGMLTMMAQMVLRLEVLYSDMRTFTTKALNEVFNTVQKRESEISEAMLTQLPGGFEHVRTKKDDALALYCSYINLVRPIDIEENYQIHNEDAGRTEQTLDALLHTTCKAVKLKYAQVFQKSVQLSPPRPERHNTAQLSCKPIDRTHLNNQSASHQNSTG